MKTMNLVLCLLAWVMCLLPLPGTTALAQSQEENEKLRNIRKLILLLGGPDLQQLGLRDQIASSGPDAPTRQTEQAGASTSDSRGKALQGLIDRLVPVYDKYLSDTDVSEILKFYDSPTGKRVSQSMPRLREESSSVVLEWINEISGKAPVKRGGLIRSVTSGDTTKVKELLSSGADVNERNSSGTTALIAAAHKGDLELVKLLLEKGADVNARTQKGLTPLMAAVEAESPEVVQLLLAKGADANAKEEIGVNAYQLASMRKQQELMTLLKGKTSDKKPVRIKLVIDFSYKAQDCLPVRSRATDSSQKVTCLKQGQEVLPIPGIAATNGWTLIQHPAIGWVTSAYIRESLVSAEHTRVARKPRTEPSGGSNTDEPSSTGLEGTSPEKSPSPGMEPTTAPKRWWR